MEETVIDKAAAEVCKALGLKECELLASRIYDDGRVVIVTTDGRKLDWRKAETIQEPATAEATTPRKGRAK